MSIKNYGLMWDRDGVRWSGTRGNAGRLMGQGPVGSPIGSQQEVDFRQQIGVYILYRNESVVYVGQTGSGNRRLFARLKDHRTDHLADRWDKFSWFGVRKVNQNGKLSKAEGELNLNPAVGGRERPLGAVWTVDFGVDFSTLARPEGAAATVAGPARGHGGTS